VAQQYLPHPLPHFHDLINSNFPDFPNLKLWGQGKGKRKESFWGRKEINTSQKTTKWAKASAKTSA
jgi:hypothetical protein